jgi:hypothetical protein
LKYLAALVGSLVLGGCSVFGDRSGTEQASYEVQKQIANDLEIRRYPSLLVAETTMVAPSESSGRNDAFRALFDYISGANRQKTKVSMTVPVETASPSTKIAMTVPVETSSSSANSDTMRFVLPAKYTLETAPEPTDSRVRVLALPERTLAVLRFTGSGSLGEVAKRQTELRSRLAGTQWKIDGEPFSMFYDPPWTLPFFRRNEVAFPVVGD